MEHPSAERLLDTEDKQPEHYEKDKRAAGIHGHTFQYKYCALVYLRAKNKGYKFKLASNVEGLGAFDDVVIEYLDGTYRKKHIFLHLQRKVKRHISMSQLKSKEGNFSLRKYYESYIKVEKNFNCSEEGVKINSSVDENLFIIHTDADVARDLLSKNLTDIGEEEFLLTGGDVLQFNEEEHKDIYEHLQELPKHREFLSRFRIFYGQADEEEMDSYIKRELQKSINLPDSELEFSYMCFRDFMNDWWQKGNYFLKENNRKEYDPLQKTSDKLRTALVTKILDQRKSELDDLSIKYKQSAITDMQQLIEPHNAVLIFAPGQSTTLTAAKIHQMFSDTKHIILNLQQLLRYKTEVLLAWKSSFDVLVLESQSSTENLQDVFNEISIILKECSVEKKFIFIAHRMGNTEQISALRRTFSAKLTEQYDDWKFTDIVTESTTFLLEKKVIFQGTEIQIKNLVKESDFRMLNALDGDSLSLVLGDEKPSIGIPIEETLDYYIDRTLDCIQNVKPGTHKESELVLLFRKGSLEELKGISACTESNCNISDHTQGLPQLSLVNENEQEPTRVCNETTELQCSKTKDKKHPYEQRNDGLGNAHRDLESKSTRVWRPGTLLDGTNRIILVVDEPGVGKSTLLTHLAKETRQRHPDTWIVRVNINNYTSILHEIKTNGIHEKVALKLLTKAAQIKKSDSVQLEKHLFNYIYNSTGNMAVLIDGVDDVVPHYTEEVIQILRILSKTKIRKIWITSRHFMKDQLEQEFQCQSYSLRPFSFEDQKVFLLKLWNQKCLNTKEDYVKDLANRIVELSFKHLSDGDKGFMGVPLHGKLLAEMFEEELRKCSTSRTVVLPEHINLVMLFDAYVKKKWDVYLAEKKNSDRINLPVPTDDADLHVLFLDNHKAAALQAILSTRHFEKLNDKNVQTKATDFLRRIKHGMEKTGIITDVIDSKPVFQHRRLAEYFVARWLCDNSQASQTFMRDHLFESGFSVVRSMVDRILADKYPLHQAVLDSHMRYVAKLLKRKQSINQKDRGGRTPLHVAVSCRSPQLIRLILQHGGDVSSVDSFLGLSPVEYAIRMVNWEVLSLIMEKRPVIREQVFNVMNRDCTEYIASALRAAARYGHTDLLRYLIRRENCVNMAVPGLSGTLLHEAARGNHIQTVRTLVDLGANCDIQDENGKTALHVSAETGSLEVVKFLLERQEMSYGEAKFEYFTILDRSITKLNRLNARDKDGNTPLHLAAAAGNTSTVRYLLSAGSDLRSCNTRGEYPLTVAARYGRNDTVKLLLQSCSAVKCEEIMTSALTAAIVAGQTDTTALLLTSGAPVNGGENEKPIHVASRIGHKEIVRLLLQYGASLTSRTDSGNTALHLASEAGHLSLVQYLDELQSDGLCSLNFEIETPLHLDDRERDFLVTYFTENDYNINATYANDVTFLHLACENGRYTAVEYLLKHGADVNAVNSAHHTPLHIADSRRQTRIVQLLFQDKAKFSLRDKDDITSLLAAFTRRHQDSTQHGGNIEDSVRNINSIAHFSVAQENLEVLILLSEEHEILHVLNFYWVTPLLQTVREGRNLIAEYITKETQRTSLYAAVTELIRLLKKRNVPLSQAGRLFVEAARFGFLDLLQRFVALGDDIKVKADNGESSLHTACECGHVTAIQYPSEQGAVPDSQDNSGNTALHVAVSNGHLEGTRTLVEKDANLSNGDAGGSTALHIAANNGYVNNVSLLTESFTPIDMRNGKKETALPVAASQGHEKLGRDLMEPGAGVWLRDIEGKTALDVATGKVYSEITQLIKDRAEGGKPVRSISHSDLNANPESGKVEYQQRTVNAGASADTEKDINDTHKAQMLKTVAEAALELHKYPRSALNIAAANKNLEEEQRQVEAGEALDYGDPIRSTALYVASSKGRKSIVQVTLENGSCVNMPYCQGVTPIHIAATEGNLEAVNAIRMCDPAVNHESGEFLKDLLHEAAESGDPQTVQAILKRGISVETMNNFGYTPLHVCAKCGHKELSRILLDFGANVNTKDKHGRTPLILSATNGHIDVVRELLKRGASVHIADEYGFTPLHSAAQEGNVEIVRDLLNHNASVDIKDKYDFTPLYAAARKGHVEVVQRLLNHGASVDIANIDGETPLSIAARYDHMEVIRVLLKHRAKVDHSNNDGETPLYMAARYGNVGVSQQLLNHGASVDFTSERRATPLHIAALYGHEEVIGALLNYAASVDIANDDGWTPLHEAASKGHMEVVRKLLNHGACVDIADNIGRKPLNTAASKGHVEVVRELLNHGASVDATNTDGCTPLNAAAQEGHVQVVRELLNHGANVYIARDKGWTPLNEAALNGHVEVVRELLNHGVGADFAMGRGRTTLYLAAANGRLEVIQELLNNEASVYIVKSNVSISLQAAAEMGHVEIIRELLKRDAAVDVANEDGMTPLYSAARFGHVEVVRELLNHGASVDTTNVEGCTPLIAAAQEGHVDIVRELLNHGANVYISRDEGWTPLNEAALNGNVEVVRELLNHVGVDFAIDTDWAALYLAAANGHLEVIRELLHHGASVNNANKDGWTPLNIAARCGHMEVVRELLDHGASVYIANNNVCTPLHAAAETGHAEVVRELLKRGASVDIANEDGWTPLNTAARCVHLEVVRELLNHGASVDIANNEGSTPLITAASDGHVEFVRILLHHGATADITDKGGFTALNAASQSGHVAVVEELLNRGANVNICNENGAAPLNTAALNGHVRSVRVLLNHGAEVNVANKDGFSPLYSAVSRGHIEVVRELLNHGAQVDISKEDGWSLFNAAAQRGDLEVIRELLKHALDINISKLSVWQRVKIIAEKGDMDRIRDLINHIGSKSFAKKISPE